MNIEKYLKSGHACLFVETAEIKRAVKAIQTGEQFNKLIWDSIQGIGDKVNRENLSPVELLNKAMEIPKTAIILENFDLFLENPQIMQIVLNNYETYKFNQTCLVFLGTNPKKIPLPLKELIPILSFDLPTKEEIRDIAQALVDEIQDMVKDNKDYDLKITEEIISACCGFSWEEAENTLALSLIEHKCFDTKTILDKKRQIIRATGFMDFMTPEPVENLGGLDNLKQYIFKRKDAFESDSNKPKLKSIMLLGPPGTGKTLSAKCIASIFNWPLIILDVGALKGGIVGETEKNIRLACKTIDGIGHAVVLIDK
jgi:hypothetical protein